KSLGLFGLTPARQGPRGAGCDFYPQAPGLSSQNSSKRSAGLSAGGGASFSGVSAGGSASGAGVPPPVDGGTVSGGSVSVEGSKGGSGTVSGAASVVSPCGTVRLGSAGSVSA